MQHASKLIIKKGAKVIDMCTGKSYGSIKEAAKSIAMPYSTCKNMLSGKRKNITCLQLAA